MFFLAATQDQDAVSSWDYPHKSARFLWRDIKLCSLEQAAAEMGIITSNIWWNFRFCCAKTESEVALQCAGNDWSLNISATSFRLWGVFFIAVQKGALRRCHVPGGQRTVTSLMWGFLITSIWFTYEEEAGYCLPPRPYSSKYPCPKWLEFSLTVANLTKPNYAAACISLVIFLFLFFRSKTGAGVNNRNCYDGCSDEHTNAAEDLGQAQEVFN